MLRYTERRGITVAFVTHDPDVSVCTRRIVRLHDGRLVSDEPGLEPRVIERATALEPV